MLARCKHDRHPAKLECQTELLAERCIQSWGALLKGCGLLLGRAKCAQPRGSSSTTQLLKMLAKVNSHRCFPASPKSPAQPSCLEMWRVRNTPTHPPPPQLPPTHMQWGSASLPRPGPILPLSPANNSKALPFPLHLPAGSSSPDQY